MRGRIGAIGATVLALGLTSASAQGAVLKDLQALLNPDGTGRLFANRGGIGWDEIHWEACFPGEATCSPFATARDISIGDPPVGTVFRYGTGDPDIESLPWGGRVVSLAPPAVSGPVRANEFVTPVSGGWRGGWPGDHERGQLAACKDPEGTECFTISDRRSAAGCAGGAAVLDPFFTGRFLRVAVARYGEGMNSTLDFPERAPFLEPLWQPSAVTVVSTVGRIAPASRPRTRQCGPSPLVQAEIGSDGIADVYCVFACRAVLTITRGGRIAQSARRARGRRWGAGTGPGGLHLGGSLRLRITAGARRRLGNGKARTRVTVNGIPFAKERLTLGSRKVEGMPAKLRAE